MLPLLAKIYGHIKHNENEGYDVHCMICKGFLHSKQVLQTC